MIAAGLEELRAARRQLSAAREVWMREYRKASETLKYEDLRVVAHRMDEAFKNFMRASESFRTEMRNLQGLTRDDERRTDLEIMDASVVALSTSLSLLNRGASATAHLRHEALRAAAGVYKQLAHDFA